MCLAMLKENKSCEYIGAAIDRQSRSQSCLLLPLQFQNSDFVAGMGDKWVGAAERMPQITHRETERSKTENERELEEVVTMEMMIILDMLRWCFVLPNIQATERHTQTQTEQCVVNLHCMPGWLQTNKQTRGLKDQEKAGILNATAKERHKSCREKESQYCP